MDILGTNSPIILAPLPPPPEPYIHDVRGSSIEAASAAIAKDTAEQVAAIKALGSTMTGGRRRRRYRLYGGTEVTVEPPGFNSASGMAVPQYASMMKLLAESQAQHAYDGMGNKPPVVQKIGGRKMTASHNERRVRSHRRKHGRSSRRTRRVRNTNKRLRTRRR